MEAFFNEYLAYGLIGRFGYELGTVPFFLMAVACIIVPYLIGSINFAIIFSKLFHNGDVREHGSGNAGSTNMLRTYGVKTAALTFVCDLMKGVISALIGLFMMPYYTGLVYISGLACLIGHAFPVYYGFKGGKCVYESPKVAEIAEYRAEQVESLWDEVKRFEKPHTYYVDLSHKLWELRNELLNQARHNGIG